MHFLRVGQVRESEGASKSRRPCPQVTSSKALSGVLRQLEEAGFPEGSFEVTRVGMPRPSVLLRMKGRDEAERAAQSLVTSTLRVLR